MAKSKFFSRVGIIFIAIILHVSCAPVATTVGTTPTSAPTNTTSIVQAEPNFTATPIPEVTVGEVVVDLLNIREGPGTNYPILGSLTKGEKFYILSEVVNTTSNKWLLISPSDKFLGWVIGDQTYVTIQQETVDLSTFLIWQRNMEAAKSVLSALTPTPQ